MLQLKNTTPFQATIMLMPDPDGIDSLFTVVKGTFTLAPKPVVTEDQVPVGVEQHYYGEPDQSSIRAASDVSLMKPATDVLMVGEAVAPPGRAVSQMDVSLALGPVQRTVRVFGDRQWKGGGGVYSLSTPAPFVSMPLVWERAYGGTVRSDSAIKNDPRNPVGAGFWEGGDERTIAELRVPNLEDPERLIETWKQKPPPACFAPICAHWEPRVRYAGTYGEAWQKHRAPFLPKDFDARFFQLAPPGLIASGHLKGGEPVELRGVTPRGAALSRLPSAVLKIAYKIDGSTHERPAVLDTVLIDATQSRLVLTWRAVLPCDKKALRVEEVEAALVSLN